MQLIRISLEKQKILNICWKKIHSNAIIKAKSSILIETHLNQVVILKQILVEINLLLLIRQISLI